MALAVQARLKPFPRTKGRLNMTKLLILYYSMYDHIETMAILHSHHEVSI